MFVKISLFAFILLLNSTNGQEKYIKIGDDINLSETTKITEILKNPEIYNTKKLLIEGRIRNICSADGCWITVEDENSDHDAGIIKVEGENINFPKDALNNKIKLEGYFYVLVLDEEGLGAYIEMMILHKGIVDEYIRAINKINIINATGVEIFMPASSKYDNEYYKELTKKAINDQKKMELDRQRWERIKENIILKTVKEFFK